MPRDRLIPSRSALAAMLLVLGLAACGPATLPGPDVINDPNEARNREVHEFNRGLDRVFLRPVAGAYDNGLPEPAQQGVRNFASNLNQPGYVINNLLQLRLGAAIHNTSRFVINSTIGLAGLFDPASAMGLDERETDFGETMYLWGLPEGDYVELPVLGPSTTRDTVGIVVDTALNPLRHVLDPPERLIPPVAGALAGVGARAEFADFVDAILYESEDSYAQARLLYLQNRRFELRRNSGAEETYEGIDPFADPFEVD